MKMYHKFNHTEPVKARNNIILALLGLIVVMFVGFVLLGVGKFDYAMEMQSQGRQDILEQMKNECEVVGHTLVCEGEFTDY